MKTLACAAIAAALSALATHPATAEDPIRIDLVIEVAGADESDTATPKELRESGAGMVPARPSADSRDPLAQPTKPSAAEDDGTGATPAAPAARADKAAPTPAPTPAAASEGPAPAAEKTATTSPPPFYVRLDGGHAWTGDPDGSGRNGTHDSTRVDDAAVFGIGFGKRMERDVRIDGTLTYRTPMDVAGTDGAGNAIATEVQSVSAMLNLYYDVTRLHGWLGTETITPYVGAGVGLSMLTTDDQTTAGATSEDGNAVYNTTYALMSGVTATLSERLSFDVGYRFINLGQFEQDGRFANGQTGAATKYDDLLAHELRAGIRVHF